MTPAARNKAGNTVERERLADRIAEVLDVPMAVLGVVFLAVVMTESFAAPKGDTATALTVAGWAIWSLFVAEFALRLVVAPSAPKFLKRNWWQVVFLAVPFLRGLRLLRVFRLARAGRVVSSAVRTSRSAERTLGSRIGWLAFVHLVVVVASAQLLIEFTPVDSPLEAFYLTARGAVSGEPFGVDGVVARVIEVALSTYAVVVFVTGRGARGVLPGAPPAELVSTGSRPNRSPSPTGLMETRSYASIGRHQSESRD